MTLSFIGRNKILVLILPSLSPFFSDAGTMGNQMSVPQRAEDQENELEAEANKVV